VTASFTRVFLTVEARADINAITDHDAKVAALTAMVEIERDIGFGRPLEVRSGTGDLRGCRKVYVDKPGDEKPRYRLVYWCSPDERLPRQARIIAFGERYRLKAYELAAARYDDDRVFVGQPPVAAQTDQQLGL
jgi:hypothetical protein